MTATLSSSQSSRRRARGTATTTRARSMASRERTSSATGELQLDDELELVFDHEEEGAFGALVAVNHKWLGHYARMHATFSVELSLFERNSVWMNAFFQKSRMTTSPWSAHGACATQCLATAWGQTLILNLEPGCTAAKALIKKHHRTIVERLRCAPSLHSESEFSTQSVDPVAALMFAASVDRCPEVHIILCLRLLVLLADDDADAVVRACQVAAQGQHWQPNMFVYTLLKRHSVNERICTLASELLASFSPRMPITSPIRLGSPRPASSPREAEQREPFVLRDSEPSRREPAVLAHRKTHTLPALGSIKQPAVRSPARTPHSPTTTISCLYIEAPSPYAPHTRLPLTRPPTSPLEQSRRSRVFSTPKLAAVEGDNHRRCQTPNAKSSRRAGPFQLEGFTADESAESDPHAQQLRSLDPFAASPPRSPEGESPKKRAVVLSEKYSWNPECISSVSGFEWWWRSLPQNHGSLEPTQKLKMVTKAAVRLHTKGDWQRAIELYLLALSMEINDEVQFRLRINLACAFEAAQELGASAEAFRVALALNPTDAYAQFKLGEVLGAAGDFAAARKLFEAVQDTHPQAADALKRLEESEELRSQEVEERRAATAKAKLRRSSPKQARSLRQSAKDKGDRAESLSDCVAHPAAPLSPAASTRPNKPALSKDHALVPGASDASVNGNTDSGASEPLNEAASSCASEQAGDSNVVAERESASVRSIGAMTDTATASVATVTDEGGETPLQLRSLELDRFVERCVQLDIDLRQYLMQIDSQSRGLVRLSSVCEIWRVLCGDDASASVLHRLLASDCVLEGGQTLVQYQSILVALEAKRDTAQEGRCALAAEGAVVRTRLQALIEQEALVNIRELAEASAGEWMRAGAQRAIAGCTHAPRALDALFADGNAASTSGAPALGPRPPGEGPWDTDVGERTGAVQRTADGAMDDGGDEEVAGDKVEGIAPMREGSQLTDRSDGYSALSPRLDGKRERAKREQVLLREKSRVFARKHLHCLRSLRSLALQARAHYAARAEAAASLARLARDARRTSEPSGGGASESEVEAHVTEQQHVASVSRAVWAVSAESAMRRVVLASELLALQRLARDVAAFSRVELLLPAYEGMARELDAAKPTETDAHPFRNASSLEDFTFSARLKLKCKNTDQHTLQKWHSF
ncbi:hypothetical protein PybrP1_013227 [[Pythium] brassicae (nom. inval.)]|nr:hypothetical protein PybrP1_013227 [[Pythium] brassicae (nom. inval.)]